MDKKKIFKTLILIICILIFLFLINLGRKAYIISKYSNEYKKYLEVTNYYKKSMPEDDTIVEIWRKDQLGLLKRTSKDDTKMIYYGEDYNWIFVENLDGKTAVKMKKEGEGIETQNLISGTLYINNFWDIIKMSFISKITDEKINNTKCYKVWINEEWQMYINKNNFLVMREINGSTDTGIIEYKINEVKNEDVKMPSLDGYNINDTTPK